jgi:hypothetical protein
LHSTAWLLLTFQRGSLVCGPGAAEVRGSGCGVRGAGVQADPRQRAPGNRAARCAGHRQHAELGHAPRQRHRHQARVPRQDG